MKNVIREYQKKIIICLCVIAFSIISGFLLLCTVHLLPVDNINKNIQKYITRVEYNEFIDDYVGTRIDTYTDSIMLNEAACPIEAPVIEKAIYNYQVTYLQQYSQQENLLRYLKGEEGYGYVGYTHYWGGHQVFLKILLQFFEYSDIKMMNLILQTMLLVIIIIGFIKKKKDHLVIPITLALLSIVPSVIGVCFQYSSVYYLALIGTAVILWGLEKITAEKIYLLFLLLGICTSYIDFLTFPLITLGIPLLVFVEMEREERRIKDFEKMVFLSFVWGMGYLGMWGGKWILGSLLLPESGAISEALRALRYRGSNEADGNIINLYDVLLENIFVYIKWPLIIVIIIYLIVRLSKSIKNKTFCKKRITDNVILLFPALYPIGWFFISKNHSYHHAFMTYRILSISLLAGLCFISEVTNCNKESMKI